MIDEIQGAISTWMSITAPLGIMAESFERMSLVVNVSEDIWISPRHREGMPDSGDPGVISFQPVNAQINSLS